MNTVREMVDKENMAPPRVSDRTEVHDPNLRMKQILMKERDVLEYEIRTYRGRDPLEPYYNYVLWLEKNSSDCITTVLEDVLVKFKEIPVYQQDPRLVHVLVEYISAQSNPAEVYQIVHDQGLGTKCSEFYVRWAKELEKMNDFQTTDQIFQLGMKCRAQPQEDLHNAHLQFQLRVARRVLDGGIGIFGKESCPTTQTAALNQRSSQIQNENRKLSDARKSGFQKVGGFESDRQKSSVGNHTDQMDVGRGNSAVSIQSYPSYSRNHEGVRKAERSSRKSEFRCPIAIFEPPDPLKKIHYPKHLVYVDGRDVQLEEIRAAQRAQKECAQQAAEPMNLTKSFNTQHIVTQPLLPNQNTLKLSSVPNPPVDQSLCLRTEFVQPVEKSRVQSDNSNSSQERTVYLKTEFIQPVEKPHSNPTRDPSLCLNTEFIQPVDNKSRIVDPVAVAPQKTSRPSHSEMSIRDQSWYLRTDFVEPAKTVQLSEPEATRKFAVETHSATGSAFSQRKPEVSAVPQEIERDQPLKSNEDEAFDLSCHSSKVSTSILHHSPTASFTVNTRAAMNLIQQMWESPLAPRAGSKVSQTAEDDFFKVPTARKSEYCLMTDESDRASSFTTAEERRSTVPSSIPSFDVYNEEDTNPQKDIYARLSSRSSSQKMRPVEDRLFSPMKLLEFDDEQRCDAKVAPTLPTVPPSNVAERMEDKENLPGRDPAPTADENDENMNVFDETCSTRAFQKLLPSSTPFSRPDRSRRGRISSMFNGSYIDEDERPTGICPQPYLNSTKNPTNLSLILENSKEHGSSSGGMVPKSFS